MADDDDTKSEEPKAAAHTARPGKLGSAAESGDAAVQNLLAAKDIHVQNEDEDAAKEVDDQLAEHGVK